MTPATIQVLITETEGAPARVFAYLDERDVKHSGRISGATLASVCGVKSRTWRHWVYGDRKMPTSAVRLLILVAGL